MATIAQVAQKVLEKLYVVESGATAESADLTLVTEKYNSVYGILAAQDFVSWGSAEDIPVAAVEAVVSIVADHCMSEFSTSPDVQTIVSRDAQRGMNDLRAIEYVDYVPIEQTASYF